MQKRLKRQFVFFNLLVMGCVIALLSAGILFGTKSDLSPARWGLSIALCFVLVYGASVLISKLALSPIQKAWQKQLDFTADASHELRTPLAVMLTNLELIMDNPAETVESQNKWLRNIYAENLRMTKLVDNLLTLSRADTNEQSLEVTTFMLDEAIRDTLVPLEPALTRKEVVLKTHLEQGISFCGDQKRLMQLVVLLVDNAIKYMGRPGSLDVLLKQSVKQIELTVSDTGVGIAEEHIDKLFDRFYRISKAHSKENDGSGLGLSIAKWIVESHHGTIRVESTIGVGTSFIIVLPK